MVGWRLGRSSLNVSKRNIWGGILFGSWIDACSLSELTALQCTAKLLQLFSNSFSSQWWLSKQKKYSGVHSMLGCSQTHGMIKSPCFFLDLYPLGFVPVAPIDQGHSILDWLKIHHPARPSVFFTSQTLAHQGREAKFGWARPFLVQYNYFESGQIQSLPALQT